MAYNTVTCGVNAGNTGKQSCLENFGQVELLLLVDKDFEIATSAAAILEATYTAAINASKATRMYPLFGHFNAEFEQEGRVSQEGWAGKSRTVRSGKNKATFTFVDIPFYNHLELRKHNGRTDLAVIRVTANGYIQGWSEDGTIMKGLPISDFYVNTRTDHDGSEIDASSVFIEYSGNHWDDSGVYVKPTAFDPLLLEGIKDVELSGTLAATAATITVQGTSDGVGVAGLVAANFNLYSDAAPTVPITVVVDTDNGDGTYDLTWASITGAHSLELFTQPAGTGGYESSNVVSTTV